MKRIGLAWVAALGLAIGGCSSSTDNPAASGLEGTGEGSGGDDTMGGGQPVDGTGEPPADDGDPAGSDPSSDPASTGDGDPTREPPGDGNDTADPPSSTPSDGGASAGMWLSYGNGPRNWFNNTAETTLTVDNASSLREIWRMTGEGEVTSPPAVVGDMVYVTTSRALIALAADDGTEMWRDAELGSTASAAYDPETSVLFVSSGGDMHAIDTGGNRVWGPEPISPQSGNRSFSSPVVVGDLVIVGVSSIDMGRSFRGGLVAFDKQTGEQAWLYYHVEETLAGVSVWAGPGSDGTYAYAGSGNNYGPTGDTSDSLFAVDLASGTRQWNQQMTEGDGWAFDNRMGGPDHDFGTNPIVYEMEGSELLAAGQKSGEFHVLDRTTGQIVWQQQLSDTSSAANGGVLNNGAFDGERFIVAANEGNSPGTLYGLDASPSGNGEIVWETPLGELTWAPISVANGVGLVPAGTKMLVIDTSNGNTLTEIEGGGTVAGAAAISNGRVFFGAGLAYYGTQSGQNFIALSVE